MWGVSFKVGKVQIFIKCIFYGKSCTEKTFLEITKIIEVKIVHFFGTFWVLIQISCLVFNKILEKLKKLIFEWWASFVTLLLIKRTGGPLSIKKCYHVLLKNQEKG